MKTYEENTLATMKNFYEYRESPEKLLRFSNQDDKRDLDEIRNLCAGRRMFMEVFILLASRAPLGQAIEKLLTAYKTDPRDDWAQETLYTYYSGKAMDAIKARSFEEGLMDFIKAWQYYPKGSAIPAIAGYYYLDKGDLGAASDWANKAIYLNPYNALAWIVRGRIELAKGRPELAIPLFERALDTFKNFQADMKQSPILQAFGHNNPAIFQARTYFFMGEAFRLTGNKPEALKYYEQAVYLKPDYGEALAASGKMFLDLGQIDASLQRYAKAVEAEPKNPFPHLLYSQALERVPEKKPDAIRELQEFLNLTPKDWPGRARVEEHLAQLLSGR